jgi:hypothetical protein
MDGAQTASSTSVVKCEDDRCKTPRTKVYFCVDCGTSYCEICWDRTIQHKAGRVNRDGLEHERLENYSVYKIYDSILRPTSDGEQLDRLHVEDVDTLWFGRSSDAAARDHAHHLLRSGVTGVSKDQNRSAQFEDYGRYAELMQSSPPSDGVDGTKYPQLVSFVGETST